jgi:hypothetical protein
MNQLQPAYEITRADVRKDKLLKLGAWSLPFALPVIPTLVCFILFLLSSVTPAAAVWLFFTVVSLIGGFVLGLLASGGLMFYRSRWLAGVRERLAVDGIKAQEIDWFMHELTGAERQSLKALESSNLLMADAFRDSVAARLTASRILNTARKELQLNKRQLNKLRYSRAENTKEFEEDLKRDQEKLTSIKAEAEQMKVEAEKRMHQIETAARHGTNFSETEMALKKLSARTTDLPLALESARMEEEIRKELEAGEPTLEERRK